MLNKWLGMVENASEHGATIDIMFEFTHWFMLALFVGWSGYFVYSLFRFHRSRHPEADYHGVRSHASSHLEITVVLIEAVLLIGFALPIWARRVNDFPKEGALRVRVIGQQFSWMFHYPGRDGVFGRQDSSLVSASNPIGLDAADPAGKDDIVSTNELHLPVNRAVIAEVSSKDVIHSFSLQHMRVGQDAIPGSRVPMWFKPTKVGSYEVICGQLCGLGHYAMKASMSVDSNEDFEGWMTEMEQLSAAPQPAPAS